MKKLLLPIGAALIALLSALPAHAKLEQNPDANTLWSETGQDVETGEGSSPQHWSGELGVESSADGFVLNGSDPKKFSTGRYFPVGSAFPWLVWEISDVLQQDDGYRALTVSLTSEGKFVFSVNPVVTIPKGIYSFPVFKKKPEATGLHWMRMDLYGAKVSFPVFKMVKEPENFAEVSATTFAEKNQLNKGEEVTFTVSLAQSAEDVSLTFFDSYTMPQLKINGETKLQLKPKTDEQKVWTATIKINSVEGDTLKPNEAFEQNRMLIKATVLGGEIKVPIWTGNPVPFHIKANAAQ